MSEKQLTHKSPIPRAGGAFVQTKEGIKPDPQESVKKVVVAKVLPSDPAAGPAKTKAKPAIAAKKEEK